MSTRTQAPPWTHKPGCLGKDVCSWDGTPGWKAAWGRRGLFGSHIPVYSTKGSGQELKLGRNLGAEAMEKLPGLLPVCVLYMGAYGDQKTACGSQCFFPQVGWRDPVQVLRPIGQHLNWSCKAIYYNKFFLHGANNSVFYNKTEIIHWYKIWNQELDRRRVLLLQRIWDQFPAPRLGGSQPPVTSAVGDLPPYSELQGHLCAHVYDHIQTYT